MFIYFPPHSFPASVPGVSAACSVAYAGDCFCVARSHALLSFYDVLSGLFICRPALLRQCSFFRQDRLLYVFILFFRRAAGCEAGTRFLRCEFVLRACICPSRPELCACCLIIFIFMFVFIPRVRCGKVSQPSLSSVTHGPLPVECFCMAGIYLSILFWWRCAGCEAGARLFRCPYFLLCV